jgi:hypothetical protein
VSSCDPLLSYLHIIGVALGAQQLSRFAGAIFAIVAVLQLVRALVGWRVRIAVTAIPIWASWVAIVDAGVLAWISFTVSYR